MTVEVAALAKALLSLADTAGMPDSFWTTDTRVVLAREALVDDVGRRVIQTLQDSLVYRGRYRAFPGALTGMKPPQFAVWLFELLGAQPGDELADLFPGSGAVSEAWAATRRHRGVASRDATRPLAPGDASRSAGAKPVYAGRVQARTETRGGLDAAGIGQLIALLCTNSPAVHVRLILQHHRALGTPFPQAWAQALRSVPRSDPELDDWRQAFRGTREQWRRSYEPDELLAA